MRCAAIPQNCTSAAGLCSSFRPRRKATTRKENRQRRPAELGGLGSEFDPDLIRHCTDRKSTRLNSSHLGISYAVFCLKKKEPHQPLQLRQLRQFQAVFSGNYIPTP